MLVVLTPEQAAEAKERQVAKAAKALAKVLRLDSGIDLWMVTDLLEELKGDYGLIDCWADVRNRARDDAN